MLNWICNAIWSTISASIMGTHTHRPHNRWQKLEWLTRFAFIFSFRPINNLNVSRANSRFRCWSYSVLHKVRFTRPNVCTPFPRAPLHYLMRNTSSAPSSSIAFTCFLHELSVSSTTFISIVICAHHPKSSRITLRIRRTRNVHTYFISTIHLFALGYFGAFLSFSAAPTSSLKSLK